MTDSYQTYAEYLSNYSENVSRMYGYTQGVIRYVAGELAAGRMKPKEAAEELYALEKTMQRLFDERQQQGAYERISEYFDLFKASS